ncbi:MAG: RNA pseudouridine synthase [Rhodobacteraceae bacterium]|nr:RNA pseudouridine synthase [Paracoccaceae bacterium]
MHLPFVYSPPTYPISVLHETDRVLFVDKPAGLLSVPGRLEEHKDCLLTRLEAQNSNIRLIHRLDMDTSGVMVFAKTDQAQRELNWQFEKRHVQKTYLAEVTGQIVESGTVDLPLIRDWPNRPLQKVDDKGKLSVTHWRVLARKTESCVVALTPETGRTHQLRVHMAAVGHAILGDVFYATPKVAAQSDRLMLHAQRLCLTLPDDDVQTCITAPCEYFLLP